MALFAVLDVKTSVSKNASKLASRVLYRGGEKLRVMAISSGSGVEHPMPIYQISDVVRYLMAQR